MPSMTTTQEPGVPGARSPERASGVVCLDPTGLPGWDATLTRLPGATFFHSAAWARVLKEAYGYRPAYFLTREGIELRSLLPIMEVSSWLTGRRGIARPFTDEAAPLVADSSAFESLRRAAEAFGRQRGWKYLECRGGRALFGEVPASESFFGHSLDLTGGEAAVFERFESSTRRAVRQAEKSGVQIEFSRNLESVRAFHGLLRITRQRHGVPPQPFSFFASIQRHVLERNQGWVVLARHNGIPVAGAVFFHFGKNVIYKYGASDKKWQHLRANNLVMWGAIRRYAAEGFASFDFGRTALDNEGLRKFKLGWGASEHPVDYVREDLGTGKFAAARPHSSGRMTRIFQAMPKPLSRFIGAALYKHVA